MQISDLKSKRVLVTGGSGFFASHLVKKLHSIGAEVFVLTKYNSVMDNIRLVRIWDEINPIEADLRNSDSLKQIKDIHPQYVFHFAAYNHVGDSFLHVKESLEVNGVGTANVMDAYTDYERFVYIATSEVYGHQKDGAFREDMTPFPTSPYAVGKYTGELYAQMQHHVYNRPVTLMRPFNVFGPYQSPRAIIAEMIIKCLRGEPILSTAGTQTRDFNYVENLIDGLLMAACNEKAIGYPINIGSGVETTIRNLIEMVHSLTKSSSELKIGVLPYRPTEIWRMCADSKKAQEILGWQPKVDLKQGLVRTVEWYRNYLEVYNNPKSALVNLY